MDTNSFLFQAFVYLSAAVVSVPIAKRLGLGSVLGYLFAGIIIGPFVFKFVGMETETVLHFAEFGVVLMLFLIGLELQPSRLWKLRGPILGLGGLQVGITTMIIFLIGFFLGLGWKISLAIGLILALSSTAIVLQTLNEKGLIKTEAGQSSFSVLLFQDIAVIPMLAILPLLAAPIIGSIGQSGAQIHHGGFGVEALPGWQQAILVAVVIGTIIVVGRFLVRYVFRFIAETRLREIFTAFALFLVIGIALSMQLVGLSAALGTFLAGVVLADSEYRHELESDIEPFKGLLLGLFFISVGASIDFNLLQQEPYLILGLVVGLIVIKLVILFVLGFVFKMSMSQNFLFSFSLAQGGEFAFVLFSFATQNRVIPESISDTLILVVAVSMALTPVLMIFNEKLLQPRFSNLDEKPESDTIDEKNIVIIAGFGRFGQIVGRLLHANNIGTTVLDYKPSQIDMVRKFGYKVFYGDASRIDLLHSAGASEAKLFILAIDDKEKALEIAETVKKHFPNLEVLARSFDRRHTYELMNLGVRVIQRETFNSALELGTSALRHLGFHGYQAHRAALIFKHHDEKTLVDLHEHWGDEKTFLIQMQERNQDLIDLLSSDEEELEENMDHSWERPSTK
ncbi:MAG: glutathione-regulated potassium-efflux system protein KefC [Candidatus Dadabacteria bacterium]|nr:glutathione-regulated potassium-efflux system protein KefC [Candidatus Dadabacteria bacterium]